MIKIFILFFLLTLTYLSAQEEIRVGIYQNAPKIFMNSQDEPSGFFVDILDEIALKENWKLNYTPCIWSDCLDMLENEKIDIMPDIAYTPERTKRFMFSKETVLSSWSVLYRHKGVKIDSILNLKGKKIAILKDSIQSSSIKKLLHTYNIQAHAYVEVLSFSEAFELLANNTVDCVIVNRFYELNNPLGNTVVKTNVVVEPSMVKYAFSFQKNHLADRVDFHLKELKKNQKSIFYIAKEKWLTPKASTNIPKWVLWIIFGTIIIIFILIILVVLFQRMVKKKSQELLQKEELLIIQSKHAAMGEMIGMIAHQWRQPLSVISMNANNIQLSIELKENLSTQRLLEDMQSISNEVQHLSSTIDDFRNFFKPNKTKIKINISDIIDKVNKLFVKSLKNNNIELIVKNNDNYEIETFPNELLQVVLNIINNAKDVLKENQVENSKITLSTFQTKDSYIISICDNGGGIPEDLFDKIGKQYFTTKPESGTGLGLYMSIIIVEQHLNGTLEWKNLDDGACFTISI